jgi:GH15 family glucan-1,4-alpha-glucosidase
MQSCVVEGAYRDPMVRSALTFKLLTFSLSGAVVAAPRTSLPEIVGGVRNWDYRYCWLRDAAMTFQAFVQLGFTREARNFIDWLLHATQLSRPRLEIMYDIFCENRLPECELDHLEDCRGSRPVRVGNAAHQQLQLDVYGSVIQAVHEYVLWGGELDRGKARALARFGDVVCDLWRDPDEGIWEARQAPKPHTYSKMMCWVALDRLIKLAEDGIIKAPVARFRHERNAIRNTVEAEGFNERLNSYVAWFGAEEADASLILAARCNYVTPNHPRMRSTRQFSAGLHAYRSDYCGARPARGGRPRARLRSLVTGMWDLLADNIVIVALWSLVLGLAHGGVLLVVILPLVRYMHPRMASKYYGPTRRQRLEPPASSV